MPSSRRSFLASLSSAAAMGLWQRLPGQRLWALPPNKVLGTSATIAAVLPPLDVTELRALAHAAIEAARTAGATYADVRVTAGVLLRVSSSWSAGSSIPVVPLMNTPGLGLGIGLGIRALVDGAWGFSGGDIATPEAAAAAGRAAAGLAKGSRRPGEPRVTLAPVAPATNGEWTTPIERDPFTVPIGEQGELQLEALAATMRMAGTASINVSFTWWHRIHLFASTDDALLVQHCWHARPRGMISARAQTTRAWWSQGDAMVEGLRCGGFGYEAVQPATLSEKLRGAVGRALESARAQAALPAPTEVGRYDLVLSAEAVARQLALTLGEALDLERALGYRANAEGTSFLAPPLDMLDTYQVASPLVTVRANRTAPDEAATLRWDDEGVPTTSYPLIERGRVVGYHTSRETAPELAPWFARQSRPVGCTGSMRGGGPLPPIVRVPNLTLEPARSNVTLEDLLRGVKRGFYVAASGGTADQQLMSNQFGGGVGTVYAVRDGRVREPAADFAVQYLTPKFWRSLDALGGAATARATLVGTDARTGEVPLHFPYSTVRAVPARFRQVNVLNTGRTA